MKSVRYGRGVQWVNRVWMIWKKKNNGVANLSGNPHSRFSECTAIMGLYSLKGRRLTGIGIPIITLRRSDDRIRFIMGIPILIRRRLLSELRPTSFIVIAKRLKYEDHLRRLHIPVTRHGVRPRHPFAIQCNITVIRFVSRPTCHVIPGWAIGPLLNDMIFVCHWNFNSS